MGRRFVGIASVATLAAVLAIGASPADVRAECFGADRWPSFPAAVRSAHTVVIGIVTEGEDPIPGADSVYFKLRVREVLRGTSPKVLEYPKGLLSGLPLTVCPNDAALRVRVGERIAIALGARYVGVDGPVTAVAFLTRRPQPYSLPGIEQLTADEIRFLVSLPQTDAEPGRSTGQPSNVPLLPIFLGVISGWVALRHLRSRVALP